LTQFTYAQKKRPQHAHTACQRVAEQSLSDSRRIHSMSTIANDSQRRHHPIHVRLMLSVIGRIQPSDTVNVDNRRIHQRIQSMPTAIGYIIGYISGYIRGYSRQTQSTSTLPDTSVEHTKEATSTTRTRCMPERVLSVIGWIQSTNTSADTISGYINVYISGYNQRIQPESTTQSYAAVFKIGRRPHKVGPHNQQ
jgi:ribosomal protein S8